MAINKIGRFVVKKQLGAGNQGTVYLCTDPELQRPVAIKLLNKSIADATYRAEARAMSKIQHPNIVSIYQAGMHDGTPYMVFEYVEGKLLADAVREDSLNIQQSLNVFKGLLEGISQAHQVNIVHRDLKPANIILDVNQTPKIMDFGIAKMLSGNKETDNQLIGTPRYLAPEYISKREVGSQNDVFAMGLIMVEMLTGTPVFTGNSQKMVMDAILKKDPQPPSKFNDEVEEWLDRFLLKALEKDPAHRYANGGEMLRAFNELNGGKTPAAPKSDDLHGTIEFLLRRMKRKSDFPALSQSVRSLNAMAEASDKDVNHMAGVIVKDFALTNKILKVVNSAFYGRFSGRIGTVSRAVVVLGTQAIRSLAASLIFFEHIKNKGQADHLKELVSGAMFSATFAGQVAKKLDPEEAEDYFLSALLRDLGKILVAFYLPDESKEIEQLIEKDRMNPEKAQHQVLGVDFETIGMEIAERWNFPKELVESMRAWKANDKPSNRSDKRRMVAELSHQSTELITKKGLNNKHAVEALLVQFEDTLGLDKKKYKEFTTQAFDEFHEFSKALRTDVSQPFYEKLSKGVSRTDETKLEATALSEAQTEDGLGETQILNGQANAGDSAIVDETIEIDTKPTKEDAEAMLMDGLQEVTSLLVGPHSLMDIFNVVLETMFRAMGFQRVVLVMLDRRSNQFVGRLGFGEQADLFVSRFRFPCRYTVDVFHGAIKNNVDVYIANALEEKIQADIPDWYKQISKAGSFIIFPLTVNKKTLGLIYADHPVPNGLELDKKVLNLLKSLRNQVLLAIKG